MSPPMRSSFLSATRFFSAWNATRCWNMSATQTRKRELSRVLAPGGYVHLVTPFCHPFHEYPKDYRRFTPDGLKQLAGELEAVAEGWRPGQPRRCS